jgi:hypothetical protein
MQITVSFRGVMLFRTQRGASGDFLEDVLAKWAMGYLPAPFWPPPTRAPSGIRTISVSTCFPARF